MYLHVLVFYHSKGRIACQQFTEFFCRAVVTVLKVGHLNALLITVMDSHISRLLRTHVTPAQCHLHSGSLPGTGMCHFANAHTRSLHFKLRKAERLENANNNYSLKKVSQIWALHGWIIWTGSRMKSCFKSHKLLGGCFIKNKQTKNKQKSPPHKITL